MGMAALVPPIPASSSPSVGDSDSDSHYAAANVCNCNAQLPYHAIPFIMSCMHVWVVAQFCECSVCLLDYNFINIMKNRHMFGTACIPQFSCRQEDLDSMNAYSVRISEELCRCFEPPTSEFVLRFGPDGVLEDTRMYTGLGKTSIRPV
jgi:hypothetical protein